MKVEDFFVQGRRGRVRLHEKGGKEQEMPTRHNLDRYLGPSRQKTFRTFSFAIPFNAPAVQRVGKHQNSKRSANCTSRGVPDPTGVTGETSVLTVSMMLPKPVVFEGLKVDCGRPNCG